MSQNNIESTIDNAITCEAVECFANATNSVVLQVGNKGTISVNLCDDCAKNKFGHISKAVDIHR